MGREGAETVHALEEEVWLVSKHWHLRQSVLVRDLMLQGRIALSPLPGVDSFVFTILPLQGTTTVISIKAFLDMTFYFFLIHQATEMSSKWRSKLRSAGSVTVLYPSASLICQKLGLPAMYWTMCSSLKRLCLLNTAQATHLPSEHHMMVKHGGFSLGTWGRRKRAICLWPKMPGPCLFEEQISLETKAWHFRAEKQRLSLMPWKPNKENQ